MRKNLGNNAQLFPQPVLIISTYDENQIPCAMVAAWGGIKDYHEICFACSAGHKTTKNFLAHRAFTVSFAEVGNIAESDYFGIVSGNDVTDKLAKVGFTWEKSSLVDAPIIKEYAVALECELGSYDPDHGFTVGIVKGISADESVITDGMIDITKYHPVIFDGESKGYFSFGEKVGEAWTSGMKFK